MFDRVFHREGRIRRSALLSLIASGLVASCAHPQETAPGVPENAFRAEVQRFLDTYNSLYLDQYRTLQQFEWAASTDVTPFHDGARTAAGQAYAAFIGNRDIIRRTQAYLGRSDELDPLQVKQLEAIRYAASNYPGTHPDLVNARIEAESRQSSLLDSYQFCLRRDGNGACVEPVTANDIDALLVESTDLDERLRVWEASKEVGKVLKPGLIELQRLRNEVARAMGYSSFFDLRVAEYGMSVDEMMSLLDSFVTDTAPLYQALMTWTARVLAERYHAQVPTEGIPAHWAPNRWAQSWVGIVPAANLDRYFEGRSSEWIVKQAEAFYVSMGFDPLPEVFWEKSDLYPVPEGSTRLKNAHASAWDMDLTHDVRSLMSVVPTGEWFFTAHHELGHIYYYLSYDRPEVPPILREGANRAFHEGIGELITIASGQVPYLRQQGILPPGVEINETQYLLNEALEHTITFIPWSAGTMSRFEYELYEHDLPPDQWQKTWWNLKKRYQGVISPTPDRLEDPDACDACSKTHINDDPGEYYDYAIATILKYQLHETIAKKILHQDPRSCNYFGNKEVGAFLYRILSQGATRDWREVLREATGEDLSTRAMLDYFAPLQEWLEEQNQKAASNAGGN